MLDEFSIKIKTKVVFGLGKIKDVAKYAKELHGTNVMLVADKGVQKTGIVDQIFTLLEEEHFPVTLFDEIVPNPQSYDCERGARMALEQKIDLIIAVGGGSSMDTAKAIAIANPEVLMTLPEVVAASTAIDALTHAIEGYVAKCANPITAAYGLYAIRLINQNIRDYVFHRTKEELAYQTVDVLENLVRDLNIPHFSEIDGVNPKDFDDIAEDCLSHISVASNPRLFTKEDFLKMLEETYHL